MRTTLDIDEEVLRADKELARQQGRSIGQVLSDLARQGLRGAAAPSSTDTSESFYGFRPIAATGNPVSNETIDLLREESGT